MPFQCSSYPVARETSFIDFWASGSSEESKEAIWKYVVVENLACEGFSGDVYGTLKRSIKTSRSGEEEEVGMEEEEEKEEEEEHTYAEERIGKESALLSDFLSRNNLRRREAEQDAFLALCREVESSGAVRELENLAPGLATELQQRLARVWFNFDVSYLLLFDWTRFSPVAHDFAMLCCPVAPSGKDTAIQDLESDLSGYI